MGLLLLFKTSGMSWVSGEVFWHHFYAWESGSIYLNFFLYNEFTHYTTHFGTETLLLGRLSEHTAVGLYCYLQRCSFFVKVKNYTNVRNLCISISELDGSDGFKYM